MYVFISTVRDYKNRIIYYRFVDMTNRVPIDMGIRYTKNLIIENKVVGLGLDENYNIISTNGNIDRYPIIIDGKLKGEKSPLIILSALYKDNKLIGYEVSDWLGRIAKSTVEDTIKYAKENGIANGMVKNLDGKEYVSSIKGKYIKRYLPNNSKSDASRIVWDLDYLLDNPDNILMLVYGYVKKLYINIERVENIDTKYLKDVEELIIGDRVSRIRSILNINDCDVKLKNIKYPKDTSGIEVSNRVVDILYSFSNLNNLKSVDIEYMYNVHIEHSFYNLDNLKELKLPVLIDKIQYSFSFIDGIGKLDLSLKYINKINCSFNNIKSLEELILPENVKYIQNSFNGLYNLKNLIIPKKLEKLDDNNFNILNLEKLDLSKNNLKVIGNNNFFRCPNLKSLILPEGLEYIGSNSFNQCSRLSSVYIPNSLEEIRGGVFENTSLDKVELGYNLKTIGRNSLNGCSIRFRDSDERVIKCGFYSNRIKDFYIPDNVEIIKGRILYTCIVDGDIRFSRNLRKIESGAFYDTQFKRGLNLSMCNKLEVIESCCFNKVSADYLVLPEGLKEIGMECFKESSIRYVVLPRSLEKIGARSFMYNDNSKLFYVYKDSYALGWCKKKKLPYTIINSLSEVPFLNVKDRSEDVNVLKHKMVLANNNKHKELFKPEYINNIDILFNMYLRANRGFKDDSESVELDESKLIDFPIFKINILNDIIEKERRKLRDDTPYINMYNKNNLSTRFKVLCNYITKMIDFTNLPFTTNSLDYLNSIKDNIRYNVVYIDKDSAIICLNVIIPTSHEKYMYSNKIVVIVIGDRIKFVGVVDNYGGSNFYSNLDKNYSFNKILYKPISDLIKVGDNFSTDNAVLSGIMVPKYIRQEINKCLEDRIITLDSSGNNAIMLDIDTGIVIETKGKEYIFKKQVYDLLVSGVKKLNEVNRDRLKKVYNDTAINMYMYTSYRDEYTKRISNLKGAYDDMPCYEWSMIRKFNSMGIIRLISIKSLDKEKLNDIFNTAYFNKTSITESSLNKTTYFVNSFELSDGSILIQRKYKKYKVSSGLGGDIIYLYYIEGTISRKRNIVYTSHYTIEDIIARLDKIRPKPNNERLILRNDKIYGDISKDYWIYLEVVNGYYNYYLGINRGNGGVYLLGDCKEYYIQLFRFNSIQSSISFVNKVCYSYLDSLVDDLKRGFKTKSLLGQLRNYVIEGLPNGHFIPLNLNELWNKVSKQPAQ